MNFELSTNFINKKIKELNLPYFKVIVSKNNEELFNFKYSEYDSDFLAMYSMTKVITAVAFMQLVEKGLVNTDDPVSKYLDGYDHLKLVSGEEIKRQLVIKDLLTMRGGLDYNFDRPSIVKKIEENADVSTADLCECFVLDGLLFEPGSKFNYSLCLDVIGGLIERISGMPFNKYIEDNIFKPCEMMNSSIKCDKNCVNKCIPDVGFINNKMKVLPKYDKLINLSNNYCSGGSSLISTVEDYSKFLRTLLDGKLLSKKYLKLMASPYVEETPFCKEVQDYSIASFDYGYGYGVRVRKIASPHGMPIGEFGWDGAAGSYCLCDPVNNVSIVMGMNVQGWPFYIKDLHIKVVEVIYEELKRNNLI